MRSWRPSFATRSRDSPALPTTWRRPSWFKEQALAAAEARLAELEEQPAEARPANGGFFDSLFGDRREPQRSSGSVPRTGTATREPMQGQHPGGGGFLAGAAQTALGVTGGVLGNAIAGMLGGREAKAAEPAADKGGDDKDAEDKGAEQPQDDDAHTEEAVYEVGGDDFGDFDMDI